MSLRRRWKEKWKRDNVRMKKKVVIRLGLRKYKRK